MSATLANMTTPFREKRLSLGWTLEDLAKRCQAEGLTGTSDSNLSRIERDRGGCRPPLRAALCRLLDLPITYFDVAEREARQRAAEMETT